MKIRLVLAVFTLAAATLACVAPSTNTKLVDSNKSKTDILNLRGQSSLRDRRFHPGGYLPCYLGFRIGNPCHQVPLGWAEKQYHRGD